MRQGVERMSDVRLEPEVKLMGAPFPWEQDDEQPSERPAGDG
jgi:hypothetical protein